MAKRATSATAETVDLTTNTVTAQPLSEVVWPRPPESPQLGTNQPAAERPPRKFMADLFPIKTVNIVARPAPYSRLICRTWDSKLIREPRVNMFGSFGAICMMSCKSTRRSGRGDSFHDGAHAISGSSSMVRRSAEVAENLAV